VINKPSISLHTVAVFCAYTTKMLDGVTERDELLKRHGDALKQLSASLDRLLAAGPGKSAVVS
jgi:uncharacterized protein YciI